MLFARTSKAADETEAVVEEAQNIVAASVHGDFMNTIESMSNAMTSQTRKISESFTRLQNALVADLRQAAKWGAILFVATQMFQLLVIAALIILLA